MDTTIKAQPQMTSLIPDRTVQKQVGPTAFMMGNSPGKRVGFRIEKNNSVSAKTIGFADVDLPFLLQRPHQIATATWTTASGVGDTVMEIKGEDMLKVNTLKSILSYQYFYRFNPVLEVTVSASSTAVGALLVYWRPTDFQQQTLDIDHAMLLPHEVLQPYKHASVVVKGFYQRPIRFNSWNDSKIGSFFVRVFNRLDGPSSTAAQNSISVTAYVSFEEVSTRMPKTPPPALYLDRMTLVEKRELLDQLNSIKEDEEVVRKGTDEEDLDETFVRKGEVDAAVTSEITENLSTPVVVTDTDTTEEKATEFGNTTGQTVGGHSTQYRGYMSSDHGNLKLSLQRFGIIATVPAVETNKWPTTPSTMQVFGMMMDDMVRCLAPACSYYCYSGGMRLKIVTNCDVSVKAVITVSTMSGTQYFNMRDNTEITVTIPYYFKQSARILWDKQNLATASDGQSVEVFVIGLVPPDTKMYFAISTADDFVLQYPLPIKDLKPLTWGVKPIVYDGVAPTLDTEIPNTEKLVKRLEKQREEKFVRKGLADAVKAAENAGTEIVHAIGSGLAPIAGVVDTVVGFAEDAGKILGLFDKPDAPQMNEWNVVDHAVPTVRMQYCSSDYVKHDESIPCDGRGVEMMNMSKLLEIPTRVATWSWTTAQVQGTAIGKQLCELTSHGLYSQWKSFLPRWWRGSVCFRFEFVKNVFHKGIVACVLGKGTPIVTISNYTDFQNVVFDISSGDSFDFVVPYNALTDYAEHNDSLGEVTIMVINALVAQNTTTSISVNVYMSLRDVELRVPPLPFDYIADLNKTKNYVGPWADPPPPPRRIPAVGKTPKAVEPSSEEFQRKGKMTLLEETQISETQSVKKWKLESAVFSKQGAASKECEEDYLNSCELRIPVTGKLVAGPPAAKAFGRAVIDMDAGTVHAHTKNCCFRMDFDVKATTHAQVIDAMSALMSEEPKIPRLCAPKRKMKKRKFLSIAVRNFVDDRKRYAVILKDESLVAIEFAPGLMWDAIAWALDQNFQVERRGGLATKMGEGIGKGVSNKIGVDSIKTKVIDALGTVKDKIDAVDDDVIKTMTAIAGLKVPAYLFQAASLSDYKGIVSIVLHLLGDALVALKGYRMVVDLVTALMEKVHAIVAHLTDVIPKADFGIDKSLWKIIKSVIRTVVEKPWSKFSSFVTMLKPVALMGQATRGLTYIVEFFKGILNWFGFFLSDKKKAMLQNKQWLEENSVQIDEDILNMREFIVNGNVHALATDEEAFKKIKSLALRALNYRERMLGIMSEPKCRGAADLIHNFIKKVQTLPNDPLNVTGFEPVFVLLEGPPGAGKSLYSVRLAKLFAKLLCDDERQFYRVSVDADFWTGCADQQVYVIDDLFQDPSGEGVSRLTQLISTVGCAVPKADIEGKFGMSQAKVVIGTTNSSAPTVGSLTEPAALKRRYAATHFYKDKLDGTWQRVTESSKGKREFSDVHYTDDELAVYVQKHFDRKWRRHLGLQAVEPLEEYSVLRQTLSEVREAAIRSHKSQVGEAVSDVMTDSEPPSESEVDDVMVRKGKKDFYNHATDPGALAMIYRRIFVIDNEELPEYCDFALVDGWSSVYVNTGDSANDYFAAKLRALQVPYECRVMGVNVLMSKLGTDFINHRVSTDLQDPRNRFLLAVSYWRNMDVQLVLGIAKSQGSKKVSAMLKGILNAITDFCLCATAVITAITAVVILVVFCFAMYFASQPVESKGAYDTRPPGRASSQVVGVCRKGFFEDTQPHLVKAMMGWTCVNSRGQRVNVHCLSVGQGYVLVNKHGVLVGMQHYLTYWEGAYKRVVPVHVSDATVVEFTCGDQIGEGGSVVLDLCLVWIGSTIPLRKGIIEYFVSQAQLEILSECDAAAFLERKDKVTVTGSNVKWTEKQRISQTALGEEIYQNCFVGPIFLQDGDCGSPLVVMGGPCDGKILGIASAGSVTKGVFLPITKESIQDAMGALAEVNGNTLLPNEDTEMYLRSAITIHPRLAEKTVFRSEGSDHPEIPGQNPQFLPLAFGSVEEESRVALKTKLHRRSGYTPETEMDLVSVPVKGISIAGMRNSKAKIVFEDGRKADGQIFNNRVPEADYDSPRLDKALEVVKDVYKEFVGPCRVYNEAEVLNRIDVVLSEHDVELESNPVNGSSASGHYLDKNFKKKPRGHWIVCDDAGSRYYGETLRRCVDDLERELRHGKLPTHIVEMHYKDELRPMEKIEAGKCRIFYVADFAVWCLQKKYFGDFITKFRSGHGFRGKHAIGCDPVKWWNSWGQVWKNYNLLCCDVSGWDTSVTGWHLELVRRVIESFYVGATDEDKLVRKLLIDGISWTECVLGDAVFMVSGLKSGMFATAEFNTILHTIIVYYVLDELIPSHLMIEWPFMIYGDDGAVPAVDLVRLGEGVECEHKVYVSCCGICRVSAEKQLIDVFKRGYKALGFTLTGQNKQEPTLCQVEEAVFLKRTFHPVKMGCGYLGSFYVPRMDRSTVRALIDYQRKGVPFVENVKNALVFARQGWDHEMFRWVSAMAYRHAGLNPCTWNEVASWYEPHRDEIAVIEVATWFPEPCALFRYSPGLLVQMRLKFVREVPVLAEDVWRWVEKGLQMEPMLLCEELRIEHPIFSFMRKTLARQGVVRVKSIEKLCAMWWFFCYFTEETRWRQVVESTAPVVTVSDLEKQLEVLQALPWTCPLVNVELYAALDQAEEKFPSTSEMVWWAIYHVYQVLYPDFGGSLEDVMRQFRATGMEPNDAVAFEEAEAIERKYETCPSRLSFQASVWDIEDPLEQEQMLRWMYVKPDTSSRHWVELTEHGMEEYEMKTPRCMVATSYVGGKLVYMKQLPDWKTNSRKPVASDSVEEEVPEEAHCACGCDD
ncbi:polyprotein [Biomphalaria virus 3]|uniref:polyprotein n=1 Tax=Biomphalaria virus 3 TaxID=1931371 RepID=UPI0009509093|nr:polyprotein [Biomphalaria virus 3]APS85758.1 polyprotein [Biomphalaria virus 3]